MRDAGYESIRSGMERRQLAAHHAEHSPVIAIVAVIHQPVLHAIQYSLIRSFSQRPINQRKTGCGPRAVAATMRMFFASWLPDRLTLAVFYDSTLLRSTSHLHTSGKSEYNLIDKLRHGGSMKLRRVSVSARPAVSPQ